MREIIADTHVHVCPEHDVPRLLGSLFTNLRRHSKDAILAAFLTESTHCHAFRKMADGTLTTPGFTLKPRTGKDITALEVEAPDGDKLLLYPGRQIVTSERLEILALATVETIFDGHPARQAVDDVIRHGGVPALAWAPGKWFLGRGIIVRELINIFGPASLLIGDTSLRPTVWPEPILMFRARQLGHHVVCGSDPLPIPGDEVWAGTYATRSVGVVDDNRMVSDVRDLALGIEGRPTPIGRRCPLIPFFRRWMAHHRTQKRARQEHHTNKEAENEKP